MEQENKQSIAYHHLRLVCPKCHRLLLTVQNPERLVCEIHGAYPIKNNLISFCSSSETFDLHWSDFAPTDLAKEKLVNAQQFLKPVKELLSSKSEPLRILDAGCGDGVHVKLLSNKVDSNSHLTAIDISLDAVRSAQKHGRSDWNYVHGNILELPFENDNFDVVFSYGVVAYTGDSAKAIQEITRVTRPGGYVGVWVYPKRSWLLHNLFAVTRSIVNILPNTAKRLIADAIVPILWILPTASGLNLGNATWKQCREVVLVNIAPDQLKFYTDDEIIGEMEKAGLTIFARDETAPHTLWARRR